MIRLKSLLRETYGPWTRQLEKYFKEFEFTFSRDLAPSSDDVEFVLNELGFIEKIANQFGESIDTSKTPYDAPMSGAFSHVWWLKSGKVLKFTNMASEANAAAYNLTRPKTQHVISYYDVRPLMYGNFHLYGRRFLIIADGIRPLTNNEKSTYGLVEACNFFDEDYSDEQVKEIWDRESVSQWWKYAVNQQGVDMFLTKMLPQRQAILRDVKTYGIKTMEAHSGNVGFDSHDQFVIFDYWSDSRTTPKGVARRMNKQIDLRNLMMNNADASGIDTPDNVNM